MTAVSSDTSASGAIDGLPRKPPPNPFVIGGAIAAVGFTVLTARAVGFSFTGVVESVSRPNAVVEGLLSPDWSQITNERTRDLFIETLRLAVLGTLVGAVISLPLALASTTYGNPSTVLRAVVQTLNGVIRSIPDLLWALIFVFSVGIGTLSGLLALGFFSVAVITKLTADSLDNIDFGSVEAADASGATLPQMLRTAVVPQVLPSYVSYVLYGFELNLRASAVLGFVGAGGIGNRFETFKSYFLWSELWGVVLFFVLVVFAVERLSVALRRRLV